MSLQTLPSNPVRNRAASERSSLDASSSLGPGQPAAEISQPKWFRRRLPAIARVLLGLPMVIFGLNAFLNFIPPPPTPLPEDAMAFAGALVNSGYMMPLIGLTQLLVGALLLVNRLVPLALVLLAPFLVNAVAFHVFLERSGLPPATVFTALEIYLLWAYRAALRGLLMARALPA